MHSFTQHQPVTTREDEPDQIALVSFHEPAHNTNEGSEFLDDAIRMIDQPLMHTEESIAAGSRMDLL